MRRGSPPRGKGCPFRKNRSKPPGGALLETKAWLRKLFKAHQGRSYRDDFERELFLSKEDLRPRRLFVVLLELWRPFQRLAFNNRHEELVNDAVVIVMPCLAVLPFGVTCWT